MADMIHFWIVRVILVMVGHLYCRASVYVKVLRPANDPTRSSATMDGDNPLSRAGLSIKERIYRMALPGE
jgi:hypothetical protein